MQSTTEIEARPVVPIPTEPTLSQRQKTARIMLAVALVLLGGYVLQHFLRALIWAGIFAIATSKLYRRTCDSLPHGRSELPVALLFTAGVALIFLIPFALVAYQLGNEASSIAAWVNDVRTNGLQPPGLLDHLPFGQQAVHTWWRENLADPEGARALLGRVDRAELMSRGRSLGGRLLRDVVVFAFTLVTLFFLYLQGPSLAAQASRASRRLFGAQGEAIGQQIVASVHGTVDGLVLVGLGEGFLLGIGYVFAGVPHPALLGFATAIGAMVPLGATVALALASLLVLVNGSVLTAAILFGAGVVVIFVADHFIRPSLIGGATRLPFLWVLLGILGGVETFGLLGLFLGPAVMAALVLLWRDWARPSPTPTPG